MNFCYEKLHLQIHHVRIDCISPHEIFIIILALRKPRLKDSKISEMLSYVVYYYLQHFRPKF